jgi:hypothetical protein
MSKSSASDTCPRNLQSLQLSVSRAPPDIAAHCIVLDNRFHDMNLLLTGGILFSELCPLLYNYTNTDDGDIQRADVPAELIVQLIEPIFEHRSYLRIFTLRNIIVNNDRYKKYVFLGFKPGSGCIALLVFDNVTYRVLDK